MRTLKMIGAWLIFWFAAYATEFWYGKAMWVWIIGILLTIIVMLIAFELYHSSKNEE